MTIRKATHIETQEIFNYAFVVSKEATAGNVEPNPKKAKQMVNSFLENGGYYFVFTRKKMIQGWIGLGTSYDIFSDNWIGFIQELYVLPAYRKQGIAEKLCKAASEHFSQKCYKEIQLNVFSGNHAKHLYQKLGFHDVYTTMKQDLN